MSAYTPTAEQLKELESYLCERLVERLDKELNPVKGVFESKLPFTTIEQSISDYVNEIKADNGIR